MQTQGAGLNTRYCGNCGAVVASSQSYCGRCGARAEGTVVPLDPGSRSDEALTSGSAWASPPRERTDRRRVLVPWLAAAIILLMGITAFVLQTANLGRAREDLGATRTELERAQADGVEKAEQIRSLESNLSQLERENGDLNDANSDLRAVAESCRRSANLSDRFLDSFFDLASGVGSYDYVYALGQRSVQAAKDCDARFASLGF